MKIKEVTQVDKHNKNKDAKEVKEEEKIEKTDEEVKKSVKKKLDKLEEEIAKLKADADHWKNEYYRAYADTKNLRNSIEKDYHNALRYRAEGFVEKLIPILDSFYLVLKNEPEDPALKNYLVGFTYLYKNLVNAITEEGVSEIEPVIGKKFDPNTMEALETEETSDEDNIILAVTRKGYKLHDRLLRPAGVKVTVKKKEENKPAENKDNEAEA